MDNITVNKATLINILKTNLEQHKADYKEALITYRAAVVVKARELAELADTDKEFNTNLNLTAPQDYSKEYTRLIGMLEMDIGTEVELDAHEYQQYIQDEWNWKYGASMLNSSYKTLRMSESKISSYLESKGSL